MSSTPEWLVLDHEFERCPSCDRPLAWWTAPQGHHSHEVVRRALCACGVRYAVAPVSDR